MTSEKQVFGANVRTFWDGVTALCTEFTLFARYFELMYGEIVVQAEREVAARFHEIYLRQMGTQGESFLSNRSGNVIENKGAPSGKSNDVTENKQVIANMKRCS
jgi:hypothetical protein